MSTRGFIAFANDTNDYTELFTHYDGYPEHMLTNIIMLINRDGIDTVRDTMCKHTYWSTVNHNTPDIAGVEPDENADYGTPARCAWESEAYNRTFVTGYGEYVTTDNAPRVITIEDNPLETELFEDTIWNEFGYIIHADGTVDTYANTFSTGWKKICTTVPAKHADKSYKQIADEIVDGYYPN